MQKPQGIVFAIICILTKNSKFKNFFNRTWPINDVDFVRMVEKRRCNANKCFFPVSSILNSSLAFKCCFRKIQNPKQIIPKNDMNGRSRSFHILFCILYRKKNFSIFSFWWSKYSDHKRNSNSWHSPPVNLTFLYQQTSIDIQRISSVYVSVNFS